MNRTENKRLLTIREALIIGIVLAVTIIVFCGIKLFAVSGTKAVISIDGETVKTITLSNLSWKYEIDEAKGAVIEMKDGAICVYSSDCPDKICVNTGYISKKGEKIVCLPKKLIIEIE